MYIIVRYAKNDTSKMLIPSIASAAAFLQKSQCEKSIDIESAAANVNISPVEITETMSPRQKSTATR